MKALLHLVSTRRRLVTLALLVVAAALLAPAATSQTPAAESHLDISCESGSVANETSTTGPVEHFGGDASASANAGRRLLRAEAGVQASRQDPPLRYCDVLTRFDNAVRIGPGTSGRAAGDPVSLAVTVSLDGFFNLGYAGSTEPEHQIEFVASGQVFAQVQLTDPDRPECRQDDGIEICAPAELAEFGAQGRLQQDGTFGWPGDENGELSERFRWSYELTGNRGDRFAKADDHAHASCSAWPMHYPCAAAHIPPLPPPPPDFRGTRTVLVDTFVGARLELHSVLTVLAQASTEARASANFLHQGGLLTQLAPATGFEGLELAYDLDTSPPPPPPPPPPPVPSLTISDTSVTEGDSGQTIATFTVALSAASTEQVLASYSTLPGSALGDDYDSGGGFLTFAPGEREKTVSVAVFGDEANEDDETFFVEIQEAVGATIGDRLGVATIVDDDEPVTAAGLIAEVEAELESRVEAGRGTKLADKLEDALHKVNAALSKLHAGDRTGCVGGLEGAVGEIRSAMAEGLLPAQDGVSLLERLTAAARRIADDSIAAAQDRGGSTGKIAEAQQLVARGDSRRVRGDYKAAVASYKDAVSKASGA